MYLLKSHEMVFLAQPRTGSRAVAQALSAQHGFVQVGTHHGVWPEDEPPSPDTIIISAVRNHWDTIASWYFKQPSNRRKPWDAWLRFFPVQHQRYVKRLPNGQLELYWNHLPGSTHVLRYEALQEDLNCMLALRELGPVELPVVGASEGRGGRGYRAVFEERPEARDWVARTFGDEIARLGYSY